MYKNINKKEIYMLYHVYHKSIQMRNHESDKKKKKKKLFMNFKQNNVLNGHQIYTIKAENFHILRRIFFMPSCKLENHVRFKKKLFKNINIF